MREILFKAKRLDNGEWVEGYLFDDGMPKPKRYFIGGIIIKPYEGTACDKWNVVGIDFCEIDIDTLCQYTGLVDKNGQKIWENNICIIKDGTLDEEDGCFICKWDDCTARYILDGNGLTVDFDNVDARDIEAIGNIFDNPELLEVE